MKAVKKGPKSVKYHELLRVANNINVFFFLKYLHAYINYNDSYSE